MKLAGLALTLSAVVLLGACEVRERSTEVDPHRSWWATHHQQEAYDRLRAEREHREWCERNPDRSCEGWR